MKSNWIGKAVVAIFGQKQNGFVSNVQPIRPDVVPEFLKKPEEAKREPTPAEVFSAQHAEALALGTRLLRIKEEQAAREKESAKSHSRAVEKLLPKGVAFEDFAWGCIFTSKSKALLVKAGLVKSNAKPSAGRKETRYELPLNHEDGYNAACFGPTFGTLPPVWEAEFGFENGEYRVAVKYAIWRDLKIAERVSEALAEFHAEDCDRDRLGRLIANIAPRPLSLAVPEQIQAAKKYPKS